MAEKIEVIVEANGQSSIHIQGVKGKKCIELTKEIDDLFGGPTGRKLTSEFREAEAKQKANVGR